VRQGGRLILPSSIFWRVGVSALIAVVVLSSATVDVSARDQSKDWIVLKDCRLIPNPANDGDSFHVSAGAKEYLFRLYLVDAPETDARNPGRLIEQGKYFSITVPQAIEVGQAAKDFTQEKLSQPFTVITHMSDAMGQSRLERFYAFVETKEGDLGEQLVRNGLARSYGFKTAPPARYCRQTESRSGARSGLYQHGGNQGRQDHDAGGGPATDSRKGAPDSTTE
jgi:endonuclease YncB( thermonuclease family)